MKTGIVETTRQLRFGPARGAVVHGFIRATDGSKFFLHPDDCVDGDVPRRFDRVEFEPDLATDARGPRARNVRIIEAATDATAKTFEDVTLTCSECRGSFVWEAGERAFYAAKRLHPPKKCARCRPVVRARLGFPERRGG